MSNFVQIEIDKYNLQIGRKVKIPDVKFEFIVNEYVFRFQENFNESVFSLKTSCLSIDHSPHLAQFPQTC